MIFKNLAKIIGERVIFFLIFQKFSKFCSKKKGWSRSISFNDTSRIICEKNKNKTIA